MNRHDADSSIDHQSAAYPRWWRILDFARFYRTWLTSRSFRASYGWRGGERG